MVGYLVLENGEIFEGERIGAYLDTAFELTYNTSNLGYVEIFSDPAYAGKGIVMTYPLIGNTGVNVEDLESYKIYANAIFVNEIAEFESNFRRKESLNKFLRDYNVPGLKNVDTRRLVECIQNTGKIKGYITSSINNLQEIIGKIQDFEIRDCVKHITTPKIVEYGKNFERKIALIDYGFKHSLVNYFLKRKIGVMVCPQNLSCNRILDLDPLGIVISNGPGNPEDYRNEISIVRDLCKTNKPILGIGLGYELIAIAHGFEVSKLINPHRGMNYSVKDLKNERIYVTLQNQDYYVKKGSIDENIAEISHINLNDNTVAGLKYINKDISSVQFNPESGPGAEDVEYILDEFIEKL